MKKACFFLLAANQAQSKHMLEPEQQPVQALAGLLSTAFVLPGGRGSVPVLRRDVPTMQRQFGGGKRTEDAKKRAAEGPKKYYVQGYEVEKGSWDGGGTGIIPGVEGADGTADGVSTYKNTRSRKGNFDRAKASAQGKLDAMDDDDKFKYIERSQSIEYVEATAAVDQASANDLGLDFEVDEDDDIDDFIDIDCPDGIGTTYSWEYKSESFGWTDYYLGFSPETDQSVFKLNCPREDRLNPRQPQIIGISCDTNREYGEWHGHLVIRNEDDGDRILELTCKSYKKMGAREKYR